MKLIYAACFTPCEEKDGYTVLFPDLPGCITEGDSLAEAILMATDAACGWILDELEDGKNPPPATNITEIRSSTDAIVNLIVLDMDSYAEKYGNKAVRKNLTIPAYMNTYAEKHNISLSRILQETLDNMIAAKA